MARAASVDGGSGRFHARTAVLVAAALGLLGSAGVLQATQGRRARPDVASVLYVQSPGVAKRLALGFELVVADLYWVRALQDFGGSRLGRNRSRPFDQLYPFLDIATSLDPHFTMAHRFGAIFLSEPAPGGPGRPDLAVRLLEKGPSVTWISSRV